MKCTECNGTGEIEVHSEMLMCPECFGKGEIKGKEHMSNTSETTDITKLSNEILALQISVMALNDEADKATIYVLCRMIKEKEDQLKDAKFDQETNPLPFPEK